ncbi:ABC transporter ATP-binding protein [Ignavigranum ruoffiae]|uniref:ABC transporter ATP-binding protein n=1 Tax=Ignavigranum ruoffiae TaxID=89093 RepID=UPI0024ADAE35|nr:ATP-binding cassette domain-containing protein [Ignavigranum ruoffiae]
MIECINLEKNYGKNKALNNINFKMPVGSTLGVIGQNGAGKTTLFKIILRLIEADKGKVVWKKGIDVQNQVGYLPEERGLNIKRTIEDQIRFLAKLKAMPIHKIDQQIDYWLEKFEVQVNRKDKIESLSKGNKQKIQIICSIIHRPKLLILDEPYSGLDPVNAKILSDGIAELSQEGTTIIFSSHNMTNIENVCENIIMLKAGEVVLNGSINEIQEIYGDNIVYIDNSPVIKQKIHQIKLIESIEEQKNNILKITLKDSKIGKEIFDIVCSQGYVKLFKQTSPTLDEIFRQKVSEHVE